MKVIDTNSWNRKSVYDSFKDYTNPTFSVSARLDVTKLYSYCKSNSVSFFTTFTFVAVKCLNSEEEFRLRLRHGEVVLYDVIDPSFVVKRADGAIAVCQTEFSNDYARFYKTARDAQERAQVGNDAQFTNRDETALFYITCMPWLDIISFSNPYDFKNPDQCSIPRLMWSKFTEEGGRLKMTFDVEAHHALIDGEPVCRAVNSIQCALNDVDDFLKAK